MDHTVWMEMIKLYTKDGLLINFVLPSSLCAWICKKTKKTQIETVWCVGKLTSWHVCESVCEGSHKHTNTRTKSKSLTTFGESVNYDVCAISYEIILFWYCFLSLPFALPALFLRTFFDGHKTICSILFYSFRFVWTVIIVSNWIWKAYHIFSWFLFVSSRLKMFHVQHLHAIFMHLKWICHHWEWPKREKSVTFRSNFLFITDSIFYPFANCSKRPINNMCNLWLFPWINHETVAILFTWKSLWFCFVCHNKVKLGVENSQGTLSMHMRME